MDQGELPLVFVIHREQHQVHSQHLSFKLGMTVQPVTSFHQFDSGIAHPIVTIIHLGE